MVELKRNVTRMRGRGIPGISFENEETKLFLLQVIKNNSLKRITVGKLYGPNAITSTVKKATISASDDIPFEVTINSGYELEEITIKRDGDEEQIDVSSNAYNDSNTYSKNACADFTW